MFRIAVRRLMNHRLLTSALAVGIAIAVALGSAVPLVGATAAEVGFQQQIRLGGAAAGITITEPGLTSAGAYEAFVTEAARRVHIDLGDRLGDGANYEMGSGFEIETLNGRPFSFDVSEARPSAGYYQDLQPHARLLSGSWPGDPGGGSIPAILGAPFAARTGLKLGDVLCLAVSGFIAPSPGSPAETWCTLVVGTWEPINASDPWWGTSPPTASFLMSQTGFFAGPGALTHGNQIAGHVAPVRADAMHAADASLIDAGVSELRSYYSVLGNGSLDTQLQSIVENFVARSEIAAFPLQLVAVAMLGVAFFFVAFVAAAFLAAQEVTLAVWRARGWTRDRSLSLLLIELGTTFLVALPIGLLAAAVTTLIATGAPSLNSTELTAATPSLLIVLLVTACLLALMALLASRRPLGTVARGRPSSPWWQARNLDLLIAVLALPLLFEARVRGSGAVRQAGSGVAADPIALALPTLAIAVLAVVSLRLLGPIAGLVGQLRGVAPALASGRMGRHGTEHARVGLLVVIAVAVGAFSVAYSTTESQATDDRVAYAAGADVRAHYSPDSAATAPSVDLASLGGVAASTLVLNDAGALGNSALNAQMIGVDPATFTAVAYGVSDLHPERLAADPDALILPGHPSGLALWILSPGLNIKVSAVVRDSSGRRCACSLGDLNYAGWRQLHTLLPKDAAYPLRFEALQLIVPAGLKGQAHIALSDLTTTGAGGATISGFTSSESEHWFSHRLGREPFPDRLYSDLRNPRDGQSTMTVGILDLAAGSLELAPAPQTVAMPALVGSTTLTDLGVKAGLPVLMRTVGLRDFVRAIGIVERFPTIYPGQDFVVVDRDTLLRRLAAADNRQDLPDELWVRLSGDSAFAVRTLHSDSSVDAVTDRASLAATARHDPLRLALDANLVVGFGAALLMAAAGFGLHFLIANRRRSSEYAILRANGLPQTTIWQSVLVEQLVVMGFAFPVGLFIGLVTAWALLPALELGTRPIDVYPPAAFAVDPLRLAAAFVALAAAALALGSASRHLARGRPLIEELRSLG